MTRDELVEALTVERFAPVLPVRCAKHSFLYEAVAANHAVLMSIAYADRVERRAYRCQRCRYWHITQQPREG